MLLPLLQIQQALLALLLTLLQLHGIEQAHKRSKCQHCRCLARVPDWSLFLSHPSHCCWCRSICCCCCWCISIHCCSISADADAAAYASPAACNFATSVCIFASFSFTSCSSLRTLVSRICRAQTTTSRVLTRTIRGTNCANTVAGTAPKLAKGEAQLIATPQTLPAVYLAAAAALAIDCLGKSSVHATTVAYLVCLLELCNGALLLNQHFTVDRLLLHSTAQHSMKQRRMSERTCAQAQNPHSLRRAVTASKSNQAAHSHAAGVCLTALPGAACVSTTILHTPQSKRMLRPASAYSAQLLQSAVPCAMHAMPLYAPVSYVANCSPWRVCCCC